MLHLIPGCLCSRRRESRSSRYFASASRRARCARASSLICKKKPYLNFPTFTLFAAPPISNRVCLHSSARFFCIFGLATASDDVGFRSGRRHGRGFRCDVTSEEIRLVCAAWPLWLFRSILQPFSSVWERRLGFCERGPADGIGIRARAICITWSLGRRCC